MSADNFVVVRCFGANDYRWGNFSASAVYEYYEDEQFRHGPFSSDEEAHRNACDELPVIEYGFDEDILPPGREPIQDVPDKPLTVFDKALADMSRLRAMSQELYDSYRHEIINQGCYNPDKDKLVIKAKALFEELDREYDA
jgi:hypothetical protein